MLVYIKGLMEFKFFSPYKACYGFGLINLIIVTFVYIIISFISCDSCSVEYNGKHYFGNILLIFRISGIFMFLFLVIKAIISLIKYIAIHDFSVCHSFLVLHFKDILTTVSFGESDTLIYDIIFNLVIFFGFGTFFILLFLEIIEINICKISYNTKRNIEKRAIFEQKNSEHILNDIISEEEEKEKEGENNNEAPEIEIYKIYS